MLAQAGIFVALWLTVVAAVPAGAQMAVVKSEDVQWGTNPVIPGAKIAILHGNPGQPGPFVYRIWLPADYSVAPHRHPVTENVTVLWGILHVGMGDKLERDKTMAFTAGSFFSMPADHAHYIWNKEETLIQIHGVGPTAITFVDPADDPRKK